MSCEARGVSVSHSRLVPKPSDVTSIDMASLDTEKAPADVEAHNPSPSFPLKFERREKTIEEIPVREITGIRWVLVITAILSSIFLYSLDVTIVADVQPVIIDEFQQVELLPWLTAAFLLGATATNMVWGKVYTQFNIKCCYLLNVFLFEVGSAVCGAAPDMKAMIVGRAICGVGGAGLYVGVMSLIAMTTTIQERPLYISGTGLVWGIGIVLGPVIGGAFSESSVGWRWAFYINLVIGGVCAPVWLFLIPNKDARPGITLQERMIELDWLGTILQCGGMVMFILPLSWGGIIYPWDSGKIVGTFVGAGVLFAVLGLQQIYTVCTTTTRRLIPVEFFKSRSVLLLFAATAGSGACAFVPIYFVPIFFQFTRGDGPLDAGIRLLPFIAVMVFFVFVNGALMAKWGYYMPWYLIGGLLAVTGAALMYTVDLDTATSRIYGYTVLVGAGVGMWLQASFSVAQAVVTPEQVPSAVGFMTLAQFLGITITLAIANSIFLNDSQDRILQILPGVSLSEIQYAMQGARSDLVQSLDAQQRIAVLDAIVSAIGKTYILVMTSASLVVGLSLGMKREKLFGAATHPRAAAP